MALSPMMESLSHNCVMMDKRSISDGEGGFNTAYSEGADFKTYPALDTSALARIAEAQGSKSSYTINVKKTTKLAVGDIFKDLTLGEEAGKSVYFSVTSDAKATPETSRLDLMSFKAEKMELST